VEVSKFRSSGGRLTRLTTRLQFRRKDDPLVQAKLNHERKHPDSDSSTVTSLRIDALISRLEANISEKHTLKGCLAENYGKLNVDL
jgi:hypothetical protein